MTDGGQKRVLLIGFEPGETGRVARSLGVAGHRAVPVRSAREAADAIETTGADLALVDVAGEFADVLAAVEAVRQSGAGRCPLLGIAPGARCGAIAPALRGLGFRGLVPRTADPQELVFRVNQILYADRHEASRISPRVPVNLPATLDGVDGPVEGRVLNLSETGLFVSADQLLPVNRSVTVRFALEAGAPPVLATCRVVWANAGGEGKRYFEGMGLQFLQMRPADREELHAFVAAALEALAATGAPQPRGAEPGIVVAAAARFDSRRAVATGANGMLH